MTSLVQNIVSARLIETLFSSPEYPAMFLGKETDQPAFNLIGKIVKHTQDADFIHDIIKSAMPPDYSGNTLAQVHDKVRRSIENGWADDEKPKKTSAATSLIEIADRSGIELFHDGFERTFISIAEDTVTRTMMLSSTTAARWLKHQFYKDHGRAISDSAFREALGTLMAKAQFENEAKRVYLRLARVDNKVVFNLADERGTQVVADKDGWSIANKPLAAFINTSSMAKMPIPEKGDGTAFAQFQKLMGLNDDNFHRILAFLICCLRPEGPYLFLLLEGEQGSGKSLLSELIKKMVDWGQARNLRLPSDSRDLMIQAQSSHLIVFDNVSGIKPEISDALCSLSTGGGLATRKLYTDNELQIFDEIRPFIINGITGTANRPDLLERCLSLRLPSMRDSQRQDEGNLRDNFYALLPRLMGELFDIVSCAIRRLDEVETPKAFRMADAAKWLVAAEPETGLPEGALLKALSGSQKDIVLELMASDPLAIALTKVASPRPFNGTLGDLYDRLEISRPKYDRYFPNSSSQLSKALARNRKALETFGIMVEIGPKIRKGRMVKVWLSEDGDFDEMLDDSTGYKPAIPI